MGNSFSSLRTKEPDGLRAAVTGRFGEDIQGGALYVFTNRQRARLKVLCRDGAGLWLLTKRLDQGTFSWPKSAAPDQTRLAPTSQALMLLADALICAAQNCVRGMSAMPECAG